MAEERLKAFEEAFTKLSVDHGKLQADNQQMQTRLDEQRRVAAQSSRRPEPIVDTRLMGKPRNFSGKEEDWAQWAMTTRAYAGAVSARLLLLMDQCEIQDSPSNVSLTEDSDRELSTQLYYIITMLLEGKAADKVPLAGRGEGLILRKSLTDAYEGKAAARNTGPCFRHPVGGPLLERGRAGARRARASGEAPSYMLVPRRPAHAWHAGYSTSASGKTCVVPRTNEKTANIQKHPPPSVMPPP